MGVLGSGIVPWVMGHGGFEDSVEGHPPSRAMQNEGVTIVLEMGGYEYVLIRNEPSLHRKSPRNS